VAKAAAKMSRNLARKAKALKPTTMPIVAWQRADGTVEIIAGPGAAARPDPWQTSQPATLPAPLATAADETSSAGPLADPDPAPATRRTRRNVVSIAERRPPPRPLTDFQATMLVNSPVYQARHAVKRSKAPSGRTAWSVFDLAKGRASG
jgi:hypothetical protein